MNTKKILFGILACVTLLAVSCESSSTSEEDALYEQGIRKKDITPNR